MSQASKQNSNDKKVQIAEDVPSFINEELTAVPLPIANLLSKSLLLSLYENLDTETAHQLIADTGVYAGEEFAYFYLNLEDPLDVYLTKLSRFYKQAGLGTVEIIQTKEEPAIVQVIFLREKSCLPKRLTKATFNCEFRRGFFQGALSAYTSRPCTGVRCCSDCNEHSILNKGFCAFTYYLPKY